MTLETSESGWTNQLRFDSMLFDMLSRVDYVSVITYRSRFYMTTMTPKQRGSLEKLFNNYSSDRPLVLILFRNSHFCCPHANVLMTLCSWAANSQEHCLPICDVFFLLSCWQWLIWAHTFFMLLIFVKLAIFHFGDSCGQMGRQISKRG